MSSVEGKCHTRILAIILRLGTRDDVGGVVTFLWVVMGKCYNYKRGPVSIPSNYE